MAPVSALVSKPGNRLLLTYRGDTLIALIASAEAPQDDIIHSRPNNEMAALISQAEVTRVLVRKLHASGRIGRPIEVGAVLTPGLGEYALVKGWLDRHVSLARRPFDRSRPFREVYFDYLERLAGSLELIDFIHLAYADVRNQIAPGAVPTAPPFDEPKSLPPYIPKRPGRRSALFLHNAYYHYNHLSEALRARDWDTLTVSLEPLDSANRQYMHGEDLCLHDADPDTMSRKVRDFLRTNADRFGVLQFTGQGVATLFVDNIESAADPILIPWDLMELRRRGVIVGYTPSGCLDGVSQTAIRVISQGVCGRCIWETRPDVCNDDKNLTWARKLDSFCDWVGLEADWAAEARVGPRFVKPPLITAMDPDVWRPDITPPREMIVKRAPDEFLIYHAVGNYSTRRTHEHDIRAGPENLDRGLSGVSA